jgi:TolB-like protein/Tfp pilus assembly protein PilF
VFAKSTENLEAFNHYIKGVELWEKWTKEDVASAREHFKAALKLDPKFVGALVLLAGTHGTDADMGWSENPSVSSKRNFELVQQALKLDENDPTVHHALGHVYRQKGEHEKAITAYKRAITLNPNFSQAYARLAIIMNETGQFDEAITLIKKAYRLDPKLMPVFKATLCRSYISLERYEEAREVLSQMEEHVQRGEFIPKFRLPLVRSHLSQALGREEEARAHMAEALKLNPNLPLDLFKDCDPEKIPPHVQRLLDAQRKAGPLGTLPLPLPDKPSIAVLPFTNMSGDPEQDYIGDGLSVNIISALSITTKIFVIARNSSFSYKGSNVKVQQVAEELGVQYVLEGSIQKSGDRLRVTAQLIDALTGRHLWSEVYNREMKDLFHMQDEITKKIVVSLQVELTMGEDARVYAKSTDDLEAWKHYIKGINELGNARSADFIKTHEHFSAALELDPEYVSALVGLGMTHFFNRNSKTT